MLQDRPIPFVQLHVRTWNDYVQVTDRLSSFFCFRGQSNPDWPLETSIERAATTYYEQPFLYERHERAVVSEFRRKYHLYTTEPRPSPESHFEWLAMLQHFGCPTRLLDFSHSAYVAAYFATRPKGKSAAVWGVNLHTLHRNLDRIHPGLSTIPYTARYDRNIEVARIANMILCNTAHNDRDQYILPLEIDQLTSRASRQQGLLLCPSSIQRSATGRADFMGNLAASSGDTPISELKWKDISADSIVSEEFASSFIHCIKIVFPEDVVQTAVRHLRSMGINEESLFPGLDGLARSLSLIRLA